MRKHGSCIQFQLRFWRSSHKHVQNVRNALSEWFLRHQQQAMRAFGHADTVIVEVSFDETEEPARVSVISETVQMMTVHARIFRRAGGVSQRFDVIVPPVALESTSAENLKAGLLRHLPFSLSGLRQGADQFALIVNSDSAASCLRLGRHLAELVPTLPSPCLMHQGCLSMMAVFRLGGVMSSIFCTTLLLRRRRVQALLRKALHRYVSEHVKITYDPPSPEERQRVEALMGLLYPFLAQRTKPAADGQVARTARISAWRRLRRLLSGPLGSAEVRHYCPVGCHSGEQQVRDQLEQDVTCLFLDHPPPVPAWNKWSKVVPPLAWLAVFMSLHTLLPGIVTKLTSLNAGLAFDPEDCDPDGLDGERAFLRQEQDYLLICYTISYYNILYYKIIYYIVT